MATMSKDTLIACCPDCGWDNDGKLRACIAFDTAFRARADAWRLFAEGEVDADCDDDGRGILCDVRECPECEADADPDFISTWVGTAFMRLPGDVLHRTLQTEAEGLDLIAREEAETQDRARARRMDPSTSHAAAASVRKLTEKQIALLAVFRLYYPMTDEELVERYEALQRVTGSELPKQSRSGMRTRRAELVRRGNIVNTGRKATMSTGRKAIVWGLA